MDLKGKKIVAVGLALTGEAAAAFCLDKGASVTVADIASETSLGARVQNVRDMGAKVELGPHNMETFTQADLIVISPGVPHTIPVLEAAREKGVPVVGEVELASRFIQAPIIAVTGTNGKTTVTSLIGEMMEASGISAFVGGNIGNPLVNYARGQDKAQVIVAEISSFQLDTIESFAPKVALLTNVTEDHMDRYDGMEGYAASKARVFMNQTGADFAILNGCDKWSRAMCGGIQSSQWFFTGREAAEAGIAMNAGAMDFFKGTQKQWSLSLEKMTLSGEHNKENAAAAALAAYAAGASIEGIQKAIDSFKGLPHRLEFVREVMEVKYYDDSKATNVDAVLRALEGFNAPVHLIMGGRDKGGHFRDLKDMVEQKAARLYVTGEAAGIITSALSGSVEVVQAGTIEKAVEFAKRAARPGEVVVLSPGCASFDQYKNYKERGKDFRRVVNALPA
ncbi:UDP-N-acetylmuramoyl-L-alanine--D-glutamate ligase [Desulfatibacillum aliphaticivorans]|uniref:UDP-N-acetylmuramoyl-L-alanine--D-glutamate ligase n=1 Tax=Desulfatibacillum aliphaticivorans TaxID=218208 RepID=UPI000409DEEC|nr:UDP-N-acetylmuramoyl-L-alanine--D-glutamate ligase [Desulfatibacillum aliphaticivorans]